MAISRPATSAAQAVRARTVPWRTDAAIVLVVLVVAASLRLYDLASTGQNVYYAAAMQSMLGSWHNFFFVAFDPAGALSVDKPPLGFWLQALSARTFGFHYWALALPQALAGSTAPPILYFMVRGRYGRGVAATAALALAIVPASVASARNNSLDTITMLLMLIAAWAVLRSLEDGRVRWLLPGALACGLAFNTKMFMAFVPLPAFALAYAVAWRGSWRARWRGVALAAGVLTAVSLSWVTAVGLTPANDRPVIYNGYGNSIWALTFRFNGLNHVTGTPPQSRVRSSIDGTEGQADAAELSSRAPWRLFAGRLGGQIGWFLPIAIAGSVVLLRRRARAPADVLWASWFLSALAVFTVTRELPPQYLEAMAAPTALCAAIGLAALLELARRRPVIAAAGGVGLAAYAIYLLNLSNETRWYGTGVVAAIGVSVAAVALHRGGGRRVPAWVAPVFAAGALLMGPAVWSVATALEPQTGSAARYPIGGPADLRDYPPAPGGDNPGSGQAGDDPVLAFLQQNTTSNQYLVLTERSLHGNAVYYMLVSHRPVFTLDAFATEQEAERGVSELVAAGRLRYLELQPEGPWTDPSLAFGAWFEATCRDITRPGLTPLGPFHLYDCRP